MLHKFRGKADVERWRVFSDAAFGGSSKAAFELGQDGKVRNATPERRSLDRIGASTPIMRPCMGAHAHAAMPCKIAM